MMRTTILAAVGSGLALACAVPADGAVLLVGLQMNPATSTGAYSANNYQFTSNTSSIAATKFGSVNGGSGFSISIALNDGLNVISYDNATAFNPADFGGTHTAVNLFLSASATSFNPQHPNLGGPAEVPSDLTIFAPLNGAASAATPVAGYGHLQFQRVRRGV